MARNALTIQVPGLTGLELSETALNADGHKFVAHRDAQIILVNGATEFDLTILTPVTVDGLAVADKVVTIPANETWILNLKDVSLDNYVQSDGMIYLDYDETSNGTVGVWR
jgi:hypothetical protein